MNLFYKLFDISMRLFYIIKKLYRDDRKYKNSGKKFYSMFEGRESVVREL